MPPEYYDELRLFRLEVGSIRNGKSTVNPDVHEMYDLSIGCYHHLGNALQAFLPVVQDSNDHTLNGRQTEYKHTAVWNKTKQTNWP